MYADLEEAREFIKQCLKNNREVIVKKLLFAGLFVCCCEVIAYMPHKDKATEFRIVAKSIDFSSYQVEGQVVGANLLHPDLKIGGVLEMSEESSVMKGLLEYQLNKFIKVGVLGGLTNSAKGHGELVFTGMIPLGGFDFLPFLKVNHKIVSDAGLVIYFSFEGVVFNAGLGYRPPIKSHQQQEFSLMLGTGIK